MRGRRRQGRVEAAAPEVLLLEAGEVAAVVARQDVCIGTAAKNHDLSGLKGHRLRTHGGVSEAKVPFIVGRPSSIEAVRAAGYRAATVIRGGIARGPLVGGNLAVIGFDDVRILRTPK